RPFHRWKEYQQQVATEREVCDWWRQRPHANVGVALGPVSGIVRVDVEGPGGERLLRQRSGDDLPRTWQMTTGRGRGVFYRIPPGAVLGTTIEPIKEGEELRFQAAGSQSVLPPSLHRSGHRFAWCPGLSPFEFAEGSFMPAWLVHEMRTG